MASTWIDRILEATRESESPRIYYYWAAKAAIAGVVKNQVYLDRFYHKLYPNIYVLLVGKSGLRKGPPVNLAKQLVQIVDNTRVISGRSSIQYIVKDLSTATTRPGTGAPLTDAVGFLVSSEFAAFIIADPAALTILTDLYDGHYNSEWVNATLGRDKEKLKNVCLTMLGASNEIHFRDAIPNNALGGGFVARTVIVHAERKHGINPLTRLPAGAESPAELAKYLIELAKIKGQFTWSEGGRDVYEQWYQKFSEGNYQDETGTLERLHDHVLKSAMLICLSRKTDLRLEQEDIGEAIEVCQDFIPGARRVAMGAGTVGEGKSVSAPGTAVFLKELLSRGPEYQLSRIKMGQKHWAHFDMPELDKIAESLSSQKAIEILQIRSPEGRLEIVFKLTQRVVDNYMKLQKDD